MFSNIKSLAILRYRLFSLVSEKKKLKLLRHNKKLQATLDLTKKDYAKSRRYIVKGENDIVKEYYINSDYSDSDNNILAFVGNYKGENRHGEGEEYYLNGNLKFKGKYYYGDKESGTEYYQDGKTILFVGEYRNGKRYNGDGYNLKKEKIYTLNEGKCDDVKEYDEYGQLIYQGTYENGERKKGKQYNDGALEYEGYFKNNKRHGKGKEFFGNEELFFEGNYINGLKHGEGTEYFKCHLKIKFKGYYRYGKMHHGIGYNVFNEEIHFELDNEGNGKDVEEYNYYDQLIFKGNYCNGKRHGKGIEYNPKTGHIIYKGNYINGKRKQKVKDKDLKCWIRGNVLKGKENIINKLKFARIEELPCICLTLGIVKEDILNNPNLDNIEIFSPYFQDDDIESTVYVYQRKTSNEKEINFINGIQYTYDYKYEGEFKNFFWHGQGKLFKEYYIKDEGKILSSHSIYKLLYEGNFSQDLYDGKGKEYIFLQNGNNEILFDGIYKKGEQWEGTLYNPITKEKSEIKNGNGKRFELKRESDENPEHKYYYKEAYYIDGQEIGEVKEYYLDDEGELKLQFIGNYSNGQRNGKAKIYYDYGYEKEVNFKNNKKNGLLKYKKNCEIIEADYLKGKIWNCQEYGVKDGRFKTNERILINDKPKKKFFSKSFINFYYDGEIYNGNLNGKGILYDTLSCKKKERKKIFEGKFLNGKAHGIGKKYSEDGLNIEFEGLYLNGHNHKDGKITDEIDKNFILYFSNELEDMEEYNLSDWLYERYERNRIN